MLFAKYLNRIALEMLDMDAIQVIQKVCFALTMEDLQTAKITLQKDLPFDTRAKLSHMLESSSLRASRFSRDASTVKSTGTRLNYAGKTRLFMRDGFVDRYEGTRLVFPGVLRVLSLLMPSDFPYHKNWKLSECHSLYWHLHPTLDHKVPSPRGGPDTSDNMVCTSMLNNLRKGNRTV